jgi:hypothetical protein
MLEQCAHVKPDLAIVCFTHADRAESVSRTNIENLGPWKIPEEIDRARDLNTAAWRYMFYENGVGNFETLKHMAILHVMFERRSIPYIFIWVEHAILHGQEISSCEGLQNLAGLVNAMHLQNFSIISPQIFVDEEAGHPGKESHKRFGERVAALAPFYLTGQYISSAVHASRWHLPAPALLRRLTRSLRYPRRALLMGSWDEADIKHILERGVAVRHQEERVQSLDYVIRKLPSVDSNSVNYIAIMDSRPHVQEICFRNNFMEFDLRRADDLPPPFDAIVWSYAKYLSSSTLVSRHLLNMLAVLSVSEICGLSALLVSTVEISALKANRIYSCWLNVLSSFEIQTGVFASGRAARKRVCSLYAEFSNFNTIIEETLGQTPPSLKDAMFLKEALKKSRRTNHFDSESNNYSLV